MKILRLTTLLDFGGQEKQYLSFTEKSELLKNQYIFAAIGYGGNAEKILRERGFGVHILNRNFSIRNLTTIWAVYKLIKKIKPDIIHTAAIEANFHGVLAAKLAGVPIIIAEQIGVPNNHSRMASFVFRLVYKFANKLVAISENVKQVMVLQKEANVDKIEVILNPVSIPRTYAKIPKDKFQWMFVSRLVPRKNTDTLIKAFSKLNKEKRGELHIVGEGVERIKLELLVDDLKLKSEVFFHGFQPVPEKFISQCDVFVLPAFDEGFGIVVIEAMLQKKACLCGRGGGIPEYLTHNVNGWFFDPSNIEDLVEKMNYILNLPQSKIEEIGFMAYQSTFDKFTIERYISTLENLYEQLNARKS